MRAKSKQGRKERKSSLNTQYWRHEENLSVHPGGQAFPLLAAVPVLLIRYILLIYPTVFTAAYSPGSSLTSSRMRREPVGFLGMAGWKAGSPPLHQTLSSLPGLGP